MDKACIMVFCIWAYSFMAWLDLNAKINYTLYISVCCWLLAVLVWNAYKLLKEALQEL